MTSALRFGSGGWRGRLGDEIDAASLRALGRAMDAWCRRDAGPLLLAHDGRALGPAMLACLEEGIRGPTLRVESPAPTPVLTWALARGHGRGGLQATASHNPPADHGVKAFGPDGVSLGGSTARGLERRIRAALRANPPPHPSTRGERAPVWRASGEYTRALGAQLQRRVSPAVVFDAMHGMGAVILPALWRRVHARVELLRCRCDPRFGGGAPDPRPGGLAALAKRAREAETVGLATDGDGDRFALVDETGRVCSDDEALALLIDFVVRERGARGGVVLSRPTGSLPERIARFHGLSVGRVRAGFGNGGAALCRGNAVLAGDESGGFAWSAFSHDKDGLLACALLAELSAVTPGGIRAARRRLRARVGRVAWARTALPASRPRLDRLQRLREDTPDRVGGVSVRHIEGERDLEFRFDAGFLMLRRSETEGVIRLYAEAENARALRRRMEAGRALLDDEPRSR